LLDRLLTAPFPVEDNPQSCQRRRLRLPRMLDWLAAQPGDSWQQRWLASGADTAGHAQWWQPVMVMARPGSRRCGVRRQATCASPR
jgi:hypothetical protein